MLLYGGAPMPVPAIEGALAALGPVLVQSYGQAEAPNTIAVHTRDEHRPELLGSCGLPYSAVEVAILDDGGAPVAQGEVGEVCVRGPQVMQGYLGHPELTAETLRGGWLHTGDVGYLVPSGHLFLVARQRDVIITGGFNVYPGDVEQVLMSHPGVRECVVVGVPDPTWGEAVTAVVVSDEPIDVAELSSLVREQKGPLYVPKRIEFVDELPITALGKPDRRAVRARLAPAAG
jgi:fatty-acyl-CoA synthase